MHRPKPGDPNPLHTQPERLLRAFVHFLHLTEGYHIAAGAALVACCQRRQTPLQGALTIVLDRQTSAARLSCVVQLPGQPACCRSLEAPGKCPAGTFQLLAHGMHWLSSLRSLGGCGMHWLSQLRSFVVFLLRVYPHQHTCTGTAAAWQWFLSQVT